MVTSSLPDMLHVKNTSSKKGTIVCDASALRSFMVTFPQERIIGENVRRTPLHSLLGVLAFLAKQGYEVMIPEMVAHEMGGFMRDGKSYHLEYFDNSSDEEFQKRMVYRSFFREIVRLESEGVPIHIQPPLPGNTSREADHVNHIYDIHCTDMMTIEKAAALKKQHWYGIQREEGAGDREIISYIESTNNGTTPIFILSNDGELQHHFAGKPNICALGATGFLKAVNKYHLLPLCGLRPISPEEYVPLLQKHSENLRHPDYYLEDESRSPEADRLIEKQVFLGKCSRADTYSGYSHNTLARPFQKAMKQLAKELHVEAPEAEKTEPPATMVHQPRPQGILLSKMDLSNVIIRQ